MKQENSQKFVGKRSNPSYQNDDRNYNKNDSNSKFS